MAENTEFTDKIENEVFEVQTRVTYFKMFFEDDMLGHIAHHTNLYSSQCYIYRQGASIVT